MTENGAGGGTGWGAGEQELSAVLTRTSASDNGFMPASWAEVQPARKPVTHRGG